MTASYRRSMFVDEKKISRKIEKTANATSLQFQFFRFILFSVLDTVNFLLSQFRILAVSIFFEFNFLQVSHMFSFHFVLNSKLLPA